MAGETGTGTPEEGPKIPPFFFALDMLGALLVALGLYGLCGSGVWVERLELQRYGLFLVIGGVALMAPLLTRVIHILLEARDRRQERGRHL